MTIKQSIARWEKINLLHKKGLTSAKIAKRYGISSTRVRQIYSSRKPKIQSVPKWRLFHIKKKSMKGISRVRMLVRIRDNFTCRDCGAIRMPTQVNKYNEKIKGLKGRKKLFDVHHLNGLCGKKSKKYDSVRDMDSLITLCHKCHYNRDDHSFRDL